MNPTTAMLAALFFLIITDLPAQKICVKESGTMIPLPYAEISDFQLGKTVITGNNGLAEISVLMDSDSFFVSHKGHIPVTITKSKLEEDLFTVFLEEEIFEAEEVVISASKFQEKKRDVSRQVEVITSKEIKTANQSTSADVLQNNGNVFVQKSQMGGGSPVLRGFEANKVLIVVDGIRMNNAIYRGGHLQNVITLDNSMLDRVEVVFGAGAVVYGSDALGGVMSFNTKNPVIATSDQKVNTSANVFSRFASANKEKTLHLDFNLGFRKIASVSSVTISDFDDLRQGANRTAEHPDFGKRNFYVSRIGNQDSVIQNSNVNLQKGSGYRQMDLLQKILLVQSDKVSHLLNFQFSTTNNIPRYDRLAIWNKNGPQFSQWYYGPQKRMLAAYHLDIDYKNYFFDKSRFILSFQDIEESRHDRRFNKEALNHRIENLQAYNLNGDFTRQIRKHEIRYGLETTINHVRSTASQENIVTGMHTPLDTRYPNGGSIMRTGSAYLTHTIELNDKIIINEGIRFSRSTLTSRFLENSYFSFPYNSVRQANQSLNGSIGTVFLPGNHWKISLNGSTGYRVPNVDDLSKVFESVPGRVIVPNNNLKPEYTYNGEIILNKTIHNVFKIEGSAYYTWYTNAITTGLSTYKGKDSIIYDGQLSQVQQSVNAGKAYIYGFNGAIKFSPIPEMDFYSTINYTFGRIKTDSTDYPLDHIPPIFGKTSVIFKKKIFRSELYVMYNGSKLLKNYNLAGEDNISSATSEGMPGWYTVNIRTSCNIGSHVELHGALENILDRNYRIFASGISAPGRNLVLTLKVKLSGTR